MIKKWGPEGITKGYKDKTTHINCSYYDRIHRQCSYNFKILFNNTSLILDLNSFIKAHYLNNWSARRSRQPLFGPLIGNGRGKWILNLSFLTFVFLRLFGNNFCLCSHEVRNFKIWKGEIQLRSRRNSTIASPKLLKQLSGNWSRRFFLKSKIFRKIILDRLNILYK